MLVMIEDSLCLVSCTCTATQKKSRMRSVVSKLRDRVTHLQLSVEQLKIEKEALK